MNNIETFIQENYIWSKKKPFTHLYSYKEVRNILEDGLDGPGYIYSFAFSKNPDDYEKSNNSLINDCFQYLFSSYLINTRLKIKESSDLPPLSGCNFDEYYSQRIFRNFNINFIKSANILIKLLLTYYKNNDIYSISIFFNNEFFHLKYLLYFFDEFKEEYLSYETYSNGVKIPILLALLSNPSLASLSTEELNLIFKPILKPHHLFDICNIHNSNAWYILLSNPNLTLECFQFFFNYIKDDPKYSKTFLYIPNRLTLFTPLYCYFDNIGINKDILQLILPYITYEGLTYQANHNSISLHYIFKNMNFNSDWFDIIFPIFEHHVDIFQIGNKFNCTGLMSCMDSPYVDIKTLSKILNLCINYDYILELTDKNKQSFLFYLFQNKNINQLIGILNNISFKPKLLSIISNDYELCFHNFFRNKNVTYDSYMVIKKYLTLNYLGHNNKKKCNLLHLLAENIDNKNENLNLIVEDIFKTFFNIEFDDDDDENNIKKNQNNLLSNLKILFNIKHYKYPSVYSLNNYERSFLHCIINSSSFNYHTFRLIKRFISNDIFNQPSTYNDNNTLFHLIFLRKRHEENCLIHILYFFLDNNFITSSNILRPNSDKYTPFALIHLNPTMIVTEDIRNHIIKILGNEKKYLEELNKIKNLKIFFF